MSNKKKKKNTKLKKTVLNKVSQLYTFFFFIEKKNRCLYVIGTSKNEIEIFKNVFKPGIWFL